MPIQRQNKNICFFNSNKVWGGGEKWHFEISYKLSLAGYNVFAITNKQSALYKKFYKENIPEAIKQIRIHNLSFLNVFKLIKIYHFLKRNKIDIIILGLSADAKIGGIAAWFAGTKKIIYRRGTALDVKNNIMNRFLFRTVISDIITNSEEIKKGILKNNPKIFDCNRIHVIYNGINPDYFQKIPDNPAMNNGYVVLGNAGRLVEQKGQKYLVEIVEKLSKLNINFKLIIAGQGRLENYLKKYAKKLNVSDKIDFINFVDDIRSFMAETDIFVLTSLHEGSANILLEAMASGKPIVAFNVSSIPEVVLDGKTGFLVNCFDTEQFSNRINELIVNAELRKELGLNGRKRVEECFNFSNSFDQLVNVLNN